VQELDQQHNQKLLAEYEKYQELQRKTQSMQEDYERQLAEMDRAKAQVCDVVIVVEWFGIWRIDSLAQ
jgi:putative methionine-R-sulfoxide reductase with GAF domain